MVEVFFPPARGRTLRLKVTGHSGSAPKGEDLVCAAVSSLVQTMVGGLEQEAGAVVTGSFRDGLCDITIEADADRAAELAAVSRVFRFGFERLAQHHPGHIRLVN